MDIGLSPTTWEKMAKVSPDMFCVFDGDGNFVKASDASKSILGYASEELVGRHYTELLHPDYLLPTRAVFENYFNGSKPKSFENGLVHKNGSIVPILWSAVWSEEDNAFFCVARDNTELKSNRLRLEESEQLYRTLFENNPDVIFIQDKGGLILEVNQSFCNTFGLTREEAVQRPSTSFLPPDMVPLCKEHFQESLLGSSTRYDIDLVTANQERRTYDVVKFPIFSGGEVIYIKTILKDITETVRSFETIRQQTNKLNTIFESITDGLLTLDRNWNITYLNSEAERLLHLNREHHVGQNILKLFPAETGGDFHTCGIRAFETGKAVHLTSCLKEFGLWLRVKAFPSAEGLSVYFDDITELVNSTQELEKLSLVASSTTNGVIITDNARRIEWVNEGFTRLTGYCLEEVTGKIPSEFLLSHKTDSRAFESVKKSMIDGQPVSFETMNQRKNGEEIWFSVQVNPIHDENSVVTRYVTIQTDITERVKSQQELEKLSLVASGTDNGVIITDANGLTEWVNVGFTKTTGYTLSEMVGKKPGDLLQGQETEKATVSMMSEKLRQGIHFNTMLINYKKSGEKFWVSIDITPIRDHAGNITQFIAIQKDITFRKEAEANLLKLTQDLYRQNSDLQQFSYVVSHNLRAPVANALGIADLLTKIDKSSALFDMSLSNLKQSVSQLDTVLRDMNTILSIRDSKGNLEQEQVNIRTIIEQALLSFQEPLQLCGGNIINDVEGNISVWTNKAYLYSIFYNLLSNAIKYRSEDRALTVRIKCFANSDAGMIISFADNGSGFDMRKAGDNLFKLYKRFHRDKKGRGIGLYLVKTHLETMGGHIEVSSEVGAGTRFLIYLPKNWPDSVQDYDSFPNIVTS